MPILSPCEPSADIPVQKQDNQGEFLAGLYSDPPFCQKSEFRGGSALPADRQGRHTQIYSQALK
jgi:hypothetical protein